MGFLMTLDREYFSKFIFLGLQESQRRQGLYCPYAGQKLIIFSVKKILRTYTKANISYLYSL